MRDSQALRLYVMQLLSGLAFVSLTLATGGVFITTAYSVWQREHELNIRVACGATPNAVKDFRTCIQARSASE